MSMHTHQNTPNTPQSHEQLHACGSIIDQQGREVPITESMIQQACKELEKERSESH